MSEQIDYEDYEQEPNASGFKPPMALGSCS